MRDAAESFERCAYARQVRVPIKAQVAWLDDGYVGNFGALPKRARVQTVVVLVLDDDWIPQSELPDRPAQDVELNRRWQMSDDHGPEGLAVGAASMKARNYGSPKGSKSMCSTFSFEFFPRAAIQGSMH